MDNIELNVVELEDGIKYGLFYILELNKINYAFLANENDPEDIVVRKIVIGKDEDYLERLDNEEEFNKVMIEFNKIYNKKKEGKDEE